MFKVMTMDYKKNPNIGSFIALTDKFALVPNETPKLEKEKIKEYLKVEPFEARIYDSDLLGAFVLSYKDFIFVPKNFSLNIEPAFFENYEFEAYEINTLHTALANNLTIIKEKILVHEKMKELGKIIEDITGYELITLNDKNFDTFGTSIKANDYGILINPNLSESVKEQIRELFPNIKINEGTVNDGSWIIGSGIVVNNNGCLVGHLTRGDEVLVINETFNPEL